MPVYEVTDPKTGRTVELTGEKPPTKEVLDQVFAQLPPIKPSTPQGMGRMGRAKQQGEINKLENEQMLANLTPEMRKLVEDQSPLEAGLIGMGRGFSSVGRGLGLMEDETPAAKQAIESLRDVSGGAVGLGEFIGEAAPFAAGGGLVSKAAPKIAQAKAFLPALAGAEGGVVEAGKGGDAEDVLAATALNAGLGALPMAGKAVLSKIKAGKESRQYIADLIEKGDPNVNAVAKELNAQGKVVTNKASEQVLKTISKGYDEGKATALVSIAERMDAPTKKLGRKMLEDIQKAADMPEHIGRPSDILGEAMQNRAKAIKFFNKKAGQDIGSAAQSLKGQTVDTQQISYDFLSGLEELGIKVSDDAGKINLDFTGSDFVGGGKDKLENLANRLITGSMDGLKAHRTKQFVGSISNFGKGTSDAVEGRTQDVLKRLYDNINVQLKGKSQVYDKANKKFAATVDLRDAFQKLAGKDEDIFSELAGSALGGKGMRLASNAESRIPIQKVLASADEVLAREFNYKPKGKINSLVRTVTELEDLFKISRPQSFQGGIERGIAAMESPTKALLETGLERIKRIPDFDEKMKAMKILFRDN